MMNRTRSQIENLVMQFQCAFLENPTLSVTLAGAQRRFGVDEVTCAVVLSTLVDAGVLTTREGAYYRKFPHRAERPAA